VGDERAHGAEDEDVQSLRVLAATSEREREEKPNEMGTSGGGYVCF